jgi:hypothetical protein
VIKLKTMDSWVHIFYEVAGTAGAFASTALITNLGNNRSFLITPICFALAGTTWSFLGVLNFHKSSERTTALADVDQGRRGGVLSYLYSVWIGFKLL